MTSKRWAFVCLGIAGGLLAVALAAPLFLWGTMLEWAWWSVAAAGALVAAVQWAFLLNRRRQEPEAAAERAPREIDFDRPWRRDP